MRNKRGMKPWQAADLREKRGIKETNLQKWRVANDLSQNDLSVASGVPLRRIQHYEQNNGAIDGARLETLCMLCKALECNIEDILESKRLIAMYKKIK